jgi:hypothetical protein
VARLGVLCGRTRRGRTGATKNLERSLPTGLRRNERPFGVVLFSDNRLLRLTNEFAPGTDPPRCELWAAGLGRAGRPLFARASARVASVGRFWRGRAG